MEDVGYASVQYPFDRHPFELNTLKCNAYEWKQPGCKEALSGS